MIDPAEEYKEGHLPYKKIKIKISDIKVHGDGPFPFGEVDNYSEKAWGPAIAKALPELRDIVEGRKKATTENVMKALHELVEIHRVQGILSALKKGIKLDDISVLSPINRLVDGKHRVWAYMLHGDKEVAVRVYPSKSERKRLL